VVYLYTSLEQQVARTGNDRHRPLLQGVDPVKTLQDLMAVRDPLYREIADYVVETDGLTARSVAQKLGSMLLDPQ
jgi:shikimate kinase